MKRCFRCEKKIREVCTFGPFNSSCGNVRTLAKGYCIDCTRKFITRHQKSAGRTIFPILFTNMDRLPPFEPEYNMNEKPRQENPLDNYYKQKPDLRFAVLTQEEEFRLFRELKAGNEESRKFLIENHLLFAAQEARKRARGKLPDEDVVSAGNSALMACIDRFDPTKGARFTTYLRLYIRAAVSRLWTERDPVNYRKNFPEDTELDGQFRAPLEDSTETPDFAGSEFTAKCLEHLDHLKEALTDQERELLEAHYSRNEGFAEIAVREGVSREAIRTRHERLLAKLRKGFKNVSELD